MAEEFEAVDRLKRLKEDAKRAAAVIDAAKEDGPRESETMQVIEVSRPRSKKQLPAFDAAPTLQQEVAMQPVSLSTLVLASTKKRLARASHLQAASEQAPGTQWEIVDQAINEWCKSRGY
jgi:hypothetical protein